MLTPETLTRHELVGLPVRVADAANPDLVGSSGRVVEETMRTLVVRNGARERRIPKRDSTLEFRLDAAPSLDADDMRVDDTSDTRVDPDADDTCVDSDAVGGLDDGTANEPIDEAASSREAVGAAPERGEETAGVRPGQSFPTRRGSSPLGKPLGDDREAAVYVTVDGTRLLSRPALRTEHAGDTIWQSD
jgi:ribonuclease P protein subunit POP4